MRLWVSLLFLLLGICSGTGAQDPSAQAPTLVIDTGGHTSRVNRLVFTPDGKELISVSEDKTVRTWDVASGDPLSVIRPPIGPGPEGILYALAISPDGLTLAVGGYGIVPGGKYGSETSAEYEALKHGCFTKALIEGLSGEADSKDGDGEVSVAELNAYLVNRVKVLSKDKQHPETAIPPGVRSFPLTRWRP
jgi:WD40 repeat protein